jgi:hypothetical protein
MCGRYVITSPPAAVRALFGYPEQPNFPPRYNVAPTQPIPLVRLVDGKRAFALARWGLLPAWVKDPKTFSLLVGDYISCKPAATGGMGASMLFYEAIIGTIALLLAGGNLYYQREAVRVMRASAVSPRQRAAMAAISWWRSPQVAIVTLLAALTWGPFVYGLLSPSVTEFEDQYAWGALPSGETYLTVGIKTTKPDKKIILVALHYRGLGDIKDQSGIQKSLPYDYTAGLTTFVVDPDQTFRNETASGMKGVSLILLEVPKNVSGDQFSTIRKAIDLGGKIIVTRAVAPS